MATLLALGQAAMDTVLQGKVKVAVVKTALEVLGESIGVMSLTQTTKRQALAANILKTPNINILVWTAAIVTTLDNTTPSDAEILTTAASIWNDMSGVTTQEL